MTGIKYLSSEKNEVKKSNWVSKDVYELGSEDFSY